MGLALEVGCFADALLNDPEGAAFLRGEFKIINDVLAQKGLPAHTEPEDCAVWFGEAYGYSGLHALREVAALIWQGAEIPRHKMLDGQDCPMSDALVDAFLEHIRGKVNYTLVGRALRGIFKAKEPVKLPPFVHLVVHSDADGYYVPVDFEVPLIPKRVRNDTAHLWPLGSVLRLEKELIEVARHLEIPADLHSDDDVLEACLETPNRAEDAPLWQAQPIVTYHCLILREACAHSLANGAAIHFC